MLWAEIGDLDFRRLTFRWRGLVDENYNTARSS
jgi:hypothetical protein